MPTEQQLTTLQGGGRKYYGSLQRKPSLIAPVGFSIVQIITTLVEHSTVAFTKTVVSASQTTVTATATMTKVVSGSNGTLEYTIDSARPLSTRTITIIVIAVGGGVAFWLFMCMFGGAITYRYRKHTAAKRAKALFNARQPTLPAIGNIDLRDSIDEALDRYGSIDPPFHMSPNGTFEMQPLPRPVFEPRDPRDKALRILGIREELVHPDFRKGVPRRPSPPRRPGKNDKALRIMGLSDDPMPTGVPFPTTRLRRSPSPPGPNDKALRLLGLREPKPFQPENVSLESVSEVPSIGRLPHEYDREDQESIVVEQGRLSDPFQNWTVSAGSPVLPTALTSFEPAMGYSSRHVETSQEIIDGGDEYRGRSRTEDPDFVSWYVARHPTHEDVSPTRRPRRL
jgi:hypothetical protein